MEWSIRIPSGIFSFRGPGAVSSSAVNNASQQPISENPYGTGSAYSYGLTIQLQWLDKKKFILGMETGYESLSSKTQVFNVGPQTWSFLNGKTILTNQFIILHPFFGKRIKLFKELETDLTVGADFDFCLKSTENITLNTSQGTIRQANERAYPSMDFRPRIDFINYFNKVGFSLGYSHGIIDYASAQNGNSGAVYSRIIRISVAYRFLKNR
jgi:hypothetical protein